MTITPSKEPDTVRKVVVFMIIALPILALVSAVALIFRGIPFASAHPNQITVIDYGIQGSIADMAISDDGETRYFTGSFSYVGAGTGPAVIVNSSTGELVTYPTVTPENATVRVVIPDGNGGWYVGGSFTGIGGVDQDRIAHVLSTGEVDEVFAPTFDSFGHVYSLVLDEEAGLLYVGGSFSEVNGEARNGIVVLDSTDGSLFDGFALSLNSFGVIYDLEVTSGTLYIAGNFSSISGSNRYSYAGIDISSSTTSTVTDFGDSWALGTFSTANAIAVDDNYLYIGGSFFGLGADFDISNLARVDIVTGDIDSTWKPGVDSTVYDIELTEEGTIYVGGSFSGVSGDSGQGYLAAIDVATEVSTGWAPELNASVEDIFVDGGTIYFAGNFSTVNGVTKYGAAAVDAETGLVNTGLTVVPTSGSVIYAIAAQAERVYLGGTFTAIGGRRCEGLVAIDVDSGEPTDFCHSLKRFGSVTGGRNLLLEDNLLYVGGGFEEINGESLKYAAVFDVNTNELQDVDYNLSAGFGMGDQGVYQFLIDGADIYIGGKYSSVGSNSHAALARFNKTTGVYDATFNPGLHYPNCCGGNDAEVRDFLLVDDIIYVGGYFTSVTGTVDRAHLAAFSAVDSSLLDWAPEADNRVTDMQIDGTSTIYIAGNFSTINGDDRDYLASVNASTGSTTDWNPQPGGTPTALLLQDGYVYVGGSFSTIGIVDRTLFASFDLTDGSLTDWNPELDSNISASQSSINRIIKDGSTLYVAGNAITAGVQRIFNFAQFGPLTIQFNSSTFAQSETVTSTPYEIEISSSNTSSLPISVVVDITGGTATYGEDYTMVTGTVSILPGENSTSSVITIINDDSFEADETIILTVESALGAEISGNTTFTYTIQNDDVATPGVMISESDGTTAITEGGATDTYTVVLNSEPAANVTVSLTADEQATLSTSSILFTSANWDEPVTVTVTAVNDDIDEDAHTATTTHSVVSADPDYDDIETESVVATVTDNDTAGITATQSAGTTTVSEAVDGSTDSYTIVLTSEPTANVTVALDAGDDISLSTTSIVFTTENWDTPVTVTVTVVDDAIDEDNSHEDTITHVVTSADGDYDEFVINDIAVTITDDDTASMTLTEAGGSTTVTEDGATDSYTIVLGSAPTSSVTVELDINNAEVSLSTTSIVFTAENWDDVVTVTVTADNDADVEADHTSVITHSVTSDDDSYDGFVLANVTVTITDNDVAQEDDEEPTTGGGGSAFFIAPSPNTQAGQGAPLGATTARSQTTIALTPGDRTPIAIGGATHSISVEKASAEEVTVILQSTPVVVTVKKGESVEADITGDFVNDVVVQYLGILNGKTQVVVSDLIIQRKAFVINGDALETESDIVTLHILTQDVRSVAFLNSPDFADLSFTPFTSSSISWKVVPGLGEKTVYARLLLNSGNILTVSDTITVVPVGARRITNCSLEPGAAYKSKESPSVFFITESCTKRLFSNEDIFFSYFESFSFVKTVAAAELAVIADDTLGAMPMGIRARFKDGSIVKSVARPAVYLLSQGERRHILNEAAFLALRYRWDWVESITEELLDKYQEGDAVDGIPRPAYTLITYANSPKVYRLEPDPKNPEVLLKRHIVNVDVLRRLGYRTDRIVTVLDTEQYADGAPIGQASR